MSSRIEVFRRLTHWLLTLGLLIGASSVGAFQAAQSHEWPVEPQAEVELGVARPALSRAGLARYRKNDLSNSSFIKTIDNASSQASLKAFFLTLEPQSFYSKLHKLHGIFRI